MSRIKAARLGLQMLIGGGGAADVCEFLVFTGGLSGPV